LTNVNKYLALHVGPPTAVARNRWFLRTGARHRSGVSDPTAPPESAPRPTAPAGSDAEPGSGRPLRSTALAFGIYGFNFGVWQVLLADLRGALALSSGALGLALTAGLVGAIPAMAFGGRLTDRLGPPVLVGVTGLLMSLALVGVSLVGRYAVLVGLLVVYFGASGAYDVGINAAAIHAEQLGDRRVIAYFHAAFSGFAAVGALATGGLLSLGVGFRRVYAGLAVLFASVAVLLWLTSALPAGASDGDGDGASVTLFRDPAILLVAVVVCLGFFAEGSMENWSAIYLRDVLGLAAVVGASGVAAFHAAMTVGRLAGGRVTEAYRPRRVLRAAGVVGAAGMATALATDVVALVLAGFAAVGLAVSVVAPLGFSVAGDLAPDRAGEASSVVTVVGYLAFLVGPVFVGTVADLASLRLALATVVPATALVAVLGGRIGD
jgi:MFS family permease